jgi:hypothetical protein
MMQALLALPAITGDQVFTVDDYVLTLVLGAVIPVLADLLTQQFTTGWPKTVALLGLSAATAVVQDVQASGGRFTFSQLLTSFLLALATAFTVHNTVLKPIKLTGDAGVVQRVTGGFGIPGPRKPPSWWGRLAPPATPARTSSPCAAPAGPTVAELIRHPDWPQLPLGRKLRPDHDPASRRYVSRFAEAPLRSRTHRCYGLPLDQRRIGSCTGNAGAGAMNTAPLHRAGGPLYRERDAAVFYAENTATDTYPGTWSFDHIDPETGEVYGHGDDTGSDGLAMAKTLQRRGLITRYEHAFGLQQALATLANWPVITGVPWYEGCSIPTRRATSASAGRWPAGMSSWCAASTCAPAACWPSTAGASAGGRAGTSA